MCADSIELNHIKHGSGLWSKPGVPHNDWINEGVEDLGEDRKICEMCLKTEIRYVHLMVHANFPDVIEVGCICAGHLEGNYEAPKLREKSMKSRASKRKRWLNLTNWKISKKNQFYIDKDGFRVIILNKGSTFMGMIVRTTTDEKFWTRHCKTVDEAKLLSFDRITSLMA